MTQTFEVRRYDRSQDLVIKPYIFKMMSISIVFVESSIVKEIPCPSQHFKSRNHARAKSCRRHRVVTHDQNTVLGFQHFSHDLLL